MSRTLGRYSQFAAYRRGVRREARCAFTIVELLVVIGIIVLILALGVPAFNSMTRQQRLTKTNQLLSGMLTRTHIVALSNSDLAAVRIFPAAWHLDENNTQLANLADRQMIATYVWRQTASADPYNPLQVLIEERFERMPDGPVNMLPPDTWVAPAEVFATQRPRDEVYHHDLTGGRDVLGNFVLDGRIGRFELNAAASGEDFLDADDYLIVFDPQVGVVRSAQGMRRYAWQMYAFDPRPAGSAPTAQGETSGQRAGDGQLIGQYAFRRHNFTGVLIYQREPFVALGKASDSNTITARREYLSRNGLMSYVDRRGGNLISGPTAVESE